MARRLLGRRVTVAGGPPRGTWQEWVVVNARKAFAVPADLPDEQAAMYLANPLSAYAMVHEVFRVKRGSRLLVTAAGSALGKDVVRLGRRNGFRTVCVVRSDANTAELASLGAEAIIDTSRQDLVREIARLTDGQGLEYAIDCVGGELASDVVRCLGLGGHLLVYGTLSDGPMCIPSRDLMMPVAKVSGFYLGNWISQQPLLRMLRVLRAVRKLGAEGVFRADVARVYPLDDVAQAVAAAMGPGRTGKILLSIDSRRPQ
jgi:NADPH:quinone reductase-like Zn-dependent oxidoreductase